MSFSFTDDTEKSKERNEKRISTRISLFLSYIDRPLLNSSFGLFKLQSFSFYNLMIKGVHGWLCSSIQYLGIKYIVNNHFKFKWLT